jgi:hypothetical protein
VASKRLLETRAFVSHHAVVKLENAYGFNDTANHKYIGKMSFIKAQPINLLKDTNQQGPKIIYDE